MTYGVCVSALTFESTTLVTPLDRLCGGDFWCILRLSYPDTQLLTIYKYCKFLHHSSPSFQFLHYFSLTHKVSQ